MLQDRLRKKTKRPSGDGDLSLEMADISNQVPQIDDVLAEVDAAIKKADQIQEWTKPNGHWSICCGVRRWVED